MNYEKVSSVILFMFIFFIENANARPELSDPSVASEIISSGLIIIGCIFIFFRVNQIYMHLNKESRMPFGIKFPFYLAITRKL